MDLSFNHLYLMVYMVGLNNRTPNFLSFKGVPSLLPRFFRGYFYPLFINLKGITACSKVQNFHMT